MEISRYIYLATTEGCEACRIMERILKQVKRDNVYTFSIQVIDYKLLPEFIKINVLLTDFPILIFLFQLYFGYLNNFHEKLFDNFFFENNIINHQ